MGSDYVPDRLYERLFQPWYLSSKEWPLAREDWRRVEAVCDLPWRGSLLDFGSGDGTLGAMVQSRNPEVTVVHGVEQDAAQREKAWNLWHKRGWIVTYAGQLEPVEHQFDGALCCEVLEHLTEDDGAKVLSQIHDALVPGGMLCVTVPDPTDSRWDYPGHITPYGLSDLERVIRGAGFTYDNSSSEDEGEFYFPLWYMVVARA